MVVDRLGRVDVVYEVAHKVGAAITPDYHVWYAQRDPGGSTSAPVMLAGPTDSTTFVLYAVGVDGSNEPFVASQYVRQVALSRRSTAGWNEQIFANANSQSSGIAIATDGGGRPWAFSAPLLLRPTATGYTMVSVPVSETRYLAVSSAGDTAYVGSGMSAITYGMDAFWSQEMIPGQGSLPYVLTQTSDGKPVAAYTTSTGTGAFATHVYRRDASGWGSIADYPFTALDSNGQHPSNYWGTPMVFDAQLRPVIAGPPDFNGDLRVFELGPQGQTTDDVDVKLNVGSARGAVDDGGRITVAYYGDYDVYVAHERSDGGWDIVRDRPGRQLRRHFADPRRARTAVPRRHPGHRRRRRLRSLARRPVDF